MIQGNIVQMDVDAVVHPTNSSLSFGGEIGQLSRHLFIDTRLISEDSPCTCPLDSSPCPQALSPPLTSTWPHLNSDVGLEEGVY